MKKMFHRAILCICLITHFDLSALLVGSDLAVSVEAFVSFPEIFILDPNEIASFAWMKNGFALENDSTELLFRSIYPVSGTVNFNGGTVTLGTNLMFQNVTTLNGLGVVIGNGHQMHFGSSITSFPSDTVSFENTHLSFDANVSLDTNVLFSGDCGMLGGNKLLTLNPNAEIVIAENSTLHLKNFNIIGISGENIRCQDDTSLLILENIDWMQDGFFTFTVGAILFEDQVEMAGTGTFFYESPMTSTIGMNAHWKLTDDLTFKIGRYPLTLSEPIYFTDETSFLTLDNVDFLASTSGIQVTRGSIVFERLVGIDTVNTGTERGIVVGNGNSDDDIKIQLKPGSSLLHGSGYWIYNNGEPDRFESSSKSASLIRNEGSKIAIHKSVSFSKQTIEVASALVAPIEVSDGATLSYNNTHIIFPSIEFDLTGNQLSSFAYQLDGNAQMFFTKGSMPLALSVSGSDNVVKGNGTFDGPIVLNDSSAQLTMDLSEELRNIVTLNNGVMSLGSNLRLDGLATIIGPGRINLCTHEMALSPQVAQWTTPIFWNAVEDGITLQDNLELSETWTFAGEMLLNGNGNILRLLENGKLFLEPDTHLTMKDILIEGVRENNIACADDSCKLTFLNARWILESDITVTLGSITFERTGIISGPYTLTFDQESTTTIAAYSRFVLDSGITFSFGRTVQGNEPLHFVNETAELYLNGASLGIKDTGATLSRGTVLFDKKCGIEFNSTSTANGLQLGTGMAENDITLKLNPASSVRLNPGHILQNIIDIEKGFVGLSTTARLIALTGLVTHYKQDGKLANMTLELTPPTTTTFDPGVDVFFENTIVSVPPGDFLITARRFSTLVLALEGSPDGVTILNGTYPQPLVISGSGNLLEGAGIVTGLITYLSPTADLEWRNIGTLNSIITLSGGTLILGADLRIAGSGRVLGPGTIDLNDHDFFYGVNDSVQNTPLTFMGNGTIRLNSRTDLQASILLKDETTIEGFNNILTLSSGELVVDSGARLILKNMVIDQLSDSKIRCMDDTGVVIFNNIQAVLDETYTFTHGAMRFVNKNQITANGDQLFVYQTQMTSTILQDSALKLDSGVTFSYDPPSVEGNSRLLEFENSTSQLILNSARFIVTSSGIELTKGTLDVKQSSNMASTHNFATAIKRGIAFGDGIDDFNVIIRPEVALIFNSGVLEYRNLSSASLNLTNPLSSIAIGTGATLQLYENLTTGAGRIVFENLSRFLRTTTTNIIGSIEPRGLLHRGRFIP